MLNPQPLPPRETYALALADAHIQELLSLHGAGSLLGEEVMERALGQAKCGRWSGFLLVVVLQIRDYVLFRCRRQINNELDLNSSVTRDDQL
jgi:hypothetical protein